jgi:hypothetical protein
MKYYTFNQNNSGGGFDHDPRTGVGVYVIIQAQSEEDAIERAERIGLYFDGRGDCPCCGNRWGSPYPLDGTDEPRIYGELFAPCEGDEEPYLRYELPSYIHRADGMFAPLREVK